MTEPNFETLVNKERARQDRIWGEQNHDKIYWVAILGEEYGELCKALIEHHKTRTPILIETEIIHVAAVAQAMWESGKRNGWL